MTEISTTAPRNAAFYLFQALSWFGMYLIWFQGDQSSDLVRPFFGLHVGVLFLSTSFWLTESGTARNLAVRTIGTFFLFGWIETAVCLLPPQYTGTVNADMLIGNRKRTAYVGAVFILISVFSSFALSYLQFAAPSNAASRIGSLRGLLAVLAIACCIVSSAISWSWKPACTLGANGVQPANAVMILNAWIILASLLHGDGESDSVATAINAFVLFIWGPVFFYEDSVTVSHKRHKAQVAILFIGAWCFLLGQIIDRIQNEVTPLAARIALGVKRLDKLDLIALVLGIAGAVCNFARNEVDLQDYLVSYAFIIPLLSIVGVLTGTTAPKITATFLGFFFIQYYDMGSTQTYTAYTRGGMQLMEGAILLTVFSNVIRGRDLNAIVAFPSAVAIAQFVVGASSVPNNYAHYFVIALTVVAGEVFDDADYGRVAYILLIWNGFVSDFLLTVGSSPVTVLQIINFVSAAVYAINYLKGGAKQAPGLKIGNDLNAPIEAVVEAVKEVA